MKITRAQLKQIIKEELGEVAPLRVPEDPYEELVLDLGDLLERYSADEVRKLVLDLGDLLRRYSADAVRIAVEEALWRQTGP